VKIDNELYVRDYSRCLLCYKCVEACGVEAQNTLHLCHCSRQARFQRAYLGRMHGPAHGLGLRVLWQLYRGLPCALAWGAPRAYETITTTKEDILWHSMLSILLQAIPSRRTTR
jgi:ferredoxin